ncbi:peptidoglycan recognition protein family protein [Actinacidiphila glaucinigra]|uniref:Putative peptidoglycan binding domain-containing protein n=1 Tax=Actinacidiphila glaucinigra TaxID=235986 RepID=A0A239F1B9_9ACTN|nr:N-acetylmuramoyl-L-alanine amidase [Actinacidiphila glaucinigra]SNS50625.1 Putative peptidoglycan binding domain-containing protein [Actinacidiphila glaucinigra]
MSLSIVSRKAWGAKPWDGSPDQVSLSERTEFFVHYHGGVPAHSTGVAVPREVEKIHLANKWAGVGYNFMVDQDGTIYEGRGWSLQGAHCPDHNVSGFGVYVAIGGDQKPTDKALASVRALYDEACKKTGRALAKRGHKDGFATACPGVHLYAWVKDGMPAPKGSKPPVEPPKGPKPPAPKPPVSRIVDLSAGVKPGAKHKQVRELQQLLIKAGYGPIKGAVTDFYGPETMRAVARFHDRNPKYRTGLHDPRIGPKGFVALQKQAGRR